MSVTRINELPEGSGTLTSDDIFLVMDNPSGGGVTKKISLSQISAAIGGGGGGGNPFDQNLNTTDSPTFSGINLSDGLTFGDGSSQNTAPNPIDWTLILNSDNTISAYDLTSIGSNQFQYNTGIGLRIGSVTSIGDDAFAYCSFFTGNLTLPNSVTSIGNYAFTNCSGFNGNLTLPNSVTSIGNYAFRGCSGFTGSLTIGNSVTSIGNYAFTNCSGFTGDLVIPNSVTTIGNNAFDTCSSFNGNLVIPNSVTSIGSYAFAYCSGLTNVDCYIAYSVFPNSNEFSGCTFSTFHVLSSDTSWTAGTTTLGGHTFTVIKDLV